MSLLDRTQVVLGLRQVVSPDEPPPPFPPSCAQGSGLSLLDRTQVALGLRQVSPDEAALLATSAGSLAEDLRMEEEAAPQYVKDVLAAIRQGPVLPVRGTLHPSLCILVHLMYICVVHLLYLLQASAFLLDLEVVAAHHAFATVQNTVNWRIPEER